MPTSSPAASQAATAGGIAAVGMAVAWAVLGTRAGEGRLSTGGTSMSPPRIARANKVPATKNRQDAKHPDLERNGLVRQHAVAAEIDSQRAEEEVSGKDERDAPPCEGVGQERGQCQDVDDDEGHEEPDHDFRAWQFGNRSLRRLIVNTHAHGGDIVRPEPS